mmetsp:Transcript_17942/g.28644  ORF Transcript_17942/g.28644 Transcript_17942/m.28644 type:complete len:213 (+) Transcript_17942:261-899(+)
MKPPKPLLCFFNPPLELNIKWGVYSISTRLRNTNKILLSRISPSPFPRDAMPRHRRASYRGCLPPPGLHPRAHPRAHHHPQRTPAHTPLPQSTGSGESSVEGSSSVSTSVAGSSPVKPVYPRMQLSRSCGAKMRLSCPSSLIWYGANWPVGQVAARYQCATTVPGDHPSGPRFTQHSTRAPIGKRSSTSGASPGSGMTGSVGHDKLFPFFHS